MEVEGELTIGAWEPDVGTDIDRENGGWVLGGGGEGLDLRSKEISSFAVELRKDA